MNIQHSEVQVIIVEIEVEEIAFKPINKTKDKQGWPGQQKAYGGPRGEAQEYAYVGPGLTSFHSR